MGRRSVQNKAGQGCVEARKETGLVVAALPMSYCPIPTSIQLPRSSRTCTSNVAVTDLNRPIGANKMC